MNASTPAEGPATLYLVRHGETEWSRSGRHTGTTDLPLTEAGEATARSLAPTLADLDPALVLTSPRLRARRTAELSGLGQAQVDADLAEWDYGDYEGLTTPQIRERVPDWTIWSHPVPGGESARDVATRLDRVVERVRGAGGTCVAFAHGHSQRVLAARWLDQPVAEGRHLHLDTATYSVLGVDRGQPVIVRWNVPAT